MGLWMDRVGLFMATGLAVALWSLASGAHAFVTGFVGLCMARGLLDSERERLSGGLKTVTETLPPGEAFVWAGGGL